MLRGKFIIHERGAPGTSGSTTANGGRGLSAYEPELVARHLGPGQIKAGLPPTKDLGGGNPKLSSLVS